MTGGLDNEFIIMFCGPKKRREKGAPAVLTRPARQNAFYGHFRREKGLFWQLCANNSRSERFPSCDS